ncbi:nuclear transport factor 2 family protein [Rhizobium sp. 2MFCol3.1]|uniref:nuclear transport factor 2 family protein n=1 Tax=Rhizobium sp. 2MFCol3.1 TaxID=1246459 RepID=UPI0003801F81|nr:nuclear transport factor 2 family protein [Rhizobium sp. 2MFCol3.1]
MTPSEIVKDLVDHFSKSNFEAALALYADDATISIEFGVPAPFQISKVEMEKLIRSAVEARGGKPSPMYRDLSVQDLAVLETKDPAIVVGQWTYLSKVEGVTYENRNIIVVEVRDGKIVHSRDYHNHIARAFADGTVDHLLGAIQKMQTSQATA